MRTVSSAVSITLNIEHALLMETCSMFNDALKFFPLCLLTMCAHPVRYPGWRLLDKQPSTIIYLEKRPTTEREWWRGRQIDIESVAEREPVVEKEWSKEEERVVWVIRSGYCATCITFTFLKRWSDGRGAGRLCASCSHSVGGVYNDIKMSRYSNTLVNKSMVQYLFWYKNIQINIWKKSVVSIY